MFAVTLMYLKAADRKMKHCIILRFATVEYSKVCLIPFIFISENISSVQKKGGALRTIIIYRPM